MHSNSCTSLMPRLTPGVLWSGSEWTIQTMVYDLLRCRRSRLTKSVRLLISLPGYSRLRLLQRMLLRPLRLHRLWLRLQGTLTGSVRRRRPSMGTRGRTLTFVSGCPLSKIIFAQPLITSICVWHLPTWREALAFCGSLVMKPIGLRMEMRIPLLCVSSFVRLLRPTTVWQILSRSTGILGTL